MLRQLAVTTLGLILATCFFAGPATAQDLDRDGVPFPADCNDGNRDAGSGDHERCDGFDNDCDGVVDEGCLFVCPSPEHVYETIFGGTATAARDMRATATRLSLQAAWVDDRDGTSRVYVQRFADDGRPTGLVWPVSPMTTTAPSNVAIASGGDWSGVVWEDRAFGNVDIGFARYDGFPDPPAVAVTIEPTDQLEPAIAWLDNRWAVVFASDDGFGNFSIQLREVLDDVTVNPVAVAVSGVGANGRRPGIAPGVSGIGVVWQDSRGADSDIYFRVINKDLTPAGPELLLASTSAAEVLPAIASAGDGYVVAWIEGQSGVPQVKALLLDSAGVAIAPSVTLSTSTMTPESLRVAVTGDEALVSWLDFPAGMPQLLLARVGYDGVLRQSQHPVADLPASDSVDLVWNGAPMALVDPAVGDSLSALNLVCCGDLDGDGFDRCVDDCDDLSAAINPGATELCDGIDRDCNGEVDDVAGCVRACAGPDLPTAIPHALGSGPYFGDVDLAWNGSRVAAVWEEGSAADTPEEIVFQLLYADGTPAAPAQRFTDHTYPTFRPMVAPAPGGWLLSYSIGSIAQHEVLKLDLDGQPLAEPLRYPQIYNSGFREQLLADGQGFVQMHRASGAEITRFLSDGMQRRSEFLALDNHLDATIAWAGSRLAVIGTKSDLLTIDGVLLDAEGRVLGNPKVLVDSTVFLSSAYVAWNADDEQFALAYDQNNALRVQRFDADLNPVGSPQTVFSGGSNLLDPIIVWNGVEYLVQWEDSTFGRVRAARLDRNGSRIGDLIELWAVSDGSMEWRLRDDVIAVGGAFLSAWSVQQGTAPGMYTRAIGCCAAGDPDGDGSCINDCDESDPDRFPGNAEICDLKDNDCDGVLPQDEIDDGDNDGAVACSDCDDGDPGRFPGAPEICNMIDDNCDGFIPGEGPFEIVQGFRFFDAETMAWDSQGSGVFYDLQRGDLNSLRDSAGDFAGATDTCLVFNTTSTTRADTTLPEAGHGFFYNVSGGSQQCPGTFESGGAGQVGGRDAEFHGAVGACL